MTYRDQVAKIILEHWVEKWDNPMFPISVKCMYPNCEWEGRFPGEIAEHNADLIAELSDEKP